MHFSKSSDFSTMSTLSSNSSLGSDQPIFIFKLNLILFNLSSTSVMEVSSKLASTFTGGSKNITMSKSNFKSIESNLMAVMLNCNWEKM